MYQALYRKYRPATFTDVISQPHITNTLRNQIISGKTAHAYLFTGSRGTGKTTCARIFAKALCCENTVNGDPCNECEICRAADEFALSDIIEIDAASNGSVDDARELREAALYTPERCRYKIYIIDEVHMLSKDAFNALLKIIEEPPEHVKFIMATTELHKVLPTILSRCQRYDFMRIRTEDIAARIMDVCRAEGISITEEPAELIAKTADGGMRDALSILDRCIAFSEDITIDTVSEATGIAGRGHLFGLLEAVADKDPAKALDIISELYSRSKDMQRLCEELILQFRNVLIAAVSPQRMNIIICLPSELETLREIASKLSPDRIMEIIDELGECTQKMRGSVSKRIDMEMCLIRLCSDVKPSAASAPDLGEVNNRIDAIEKRLRNGVPAAPQKRVTPKDRFEVAPKGLQLIQQWDRITDMLRTAMPSVGVWLEGSTGYIQTEYLIINTKNDEMLKGLLADGSEIEQRFLMFVSEQVKFALEKKRIGYKEELDRSGTNKQAEEDSAPQGMTVDDVLKKAEAGGVDVEVG
ncbi:MAG: DNA polymerase III subunit gamma/tau [Oscillospiraceae bacterium]|nr:DNA polymerase III subunit gamma/tau [Oscillospiraceae bacterium]